MKKLLLLCLFCTARLAIAQESVRKNWRDFDALLPDALGISETLNESEFTPFAYYNTIIADNVSGGIEEDNAFAGGLYFGGTVNLEKAWGWKGVTFKLSGINRHGRPPPRMILWDLLFMAIR